MKRGLRHSCLIYVIIFLGAVGITALWLRAVTGWQVRRQVQRHLEEGHRLFTAQHRSARHLDQAAAEFQAALALDPDNPFAAGNLGSVRKEQQRWDEAIAAYQAALPHSPAPYYVRWSLGDIYVHRGQLEQALQEYRGALDLLLAKRKTVHDPLWLDEIDYGIKEMRAEIAKIQSGRREGTERRPFPDGL